MIGIINVGNIQLAPFAKKYTECFLKNNIEYEVIHWDREGTYAEYAENVHTFSYCADRFGSKIKRIIPYIKFTAFAKKIIKEKKYDKLVILTTQTAFMFSGILNGKYKKKYYFDYRDTSYEYIKPYAAFVNKICDNACFVSVSSPGFLQYIKTKTKVVIAHNFQDKYYAERKSDVQKRFGKRLVMGYVGVLREYDYLIKLADIFGNDSRFQFDFYGTGDSVEDIRKYCEKYDNVNVMGAYKEADKYAIIESFDMICYNYPYSFVNYPAIANKLYDGIICKKPMFGNSRTFSGKIINDNGLGISLDQDDAQICQKIYDYYNSFDTKQFAENCEKYLEAVIDDERYYRESIEDFAKKTFRDY